MQHREKPKKRRQNDNNEFKMKRLKKRPKIKYRHQNMWLEEAT